MQFGIPKNLMYNILPGRRWCHGGRENACKNNLQALQQNHWISALLKGRYRSTVASEPVAWCLLRRSSPVL